MAGPVILLTINDKKTIKTQRGQSMPGKYRDFDGQYAMIEVNFVLNDNRLNGLSHARRWLYLCLWCNAVRQRKETQTFCKLTADLAHIARIDARIVRSGVAALQHRCLIEWDGENTITVLGVKSKHQNLKWRDEGKNENLEPLILANRKRKRKRNSNNTSAVKKPTKKTYHKLFVEWWCDNYKKQFGDKYNFTAKDAKLIQNLLKSYDIDRLKRLSVVYWQMPDQFIMDNGYTIGILNAKIQAVVLKEKGFNGKPKKLTWRQKQDIKSN